MKMVQSTGTTAPAVTSLSEVNMSKHLRAYTKRGYTFGMDVDGTRATKVLKKARKIPKTLYGGYVSNELVIDAPQVATLMGDAAWMVTEIRDFERIQIDDSPWYRVIYPQEESA